MKRLFLILTVYLVSIILYSREARCDWDPPLDAEILTVQFNIGADGSIPIYEGYNDPIDTPEWQSGTRNEPAAYIKGASGKKIESGFSHQHGEDITSMEIYGYAPDQYFGELSHETVIFSEEYGIEEFTYSNPAPNYVKDHGIGFYWYVTKVNTVTLGTPVYLGLTTHEFYIILSTPISPMTQPWDDVLEYACNWASGETTATDVVDEITYNTYWNYGSKYYTGQNSNVNAGCTELKLANLLADTEIDCKDLAATVQVFSNALGVDNLGIIMVTPPSDPPLGTKPINLMGHSTTEWQTRNFYNHAFANYPNTTYIFDATCRVDSTDAQIPMGYHIDNEYKPAFLSNPSTQWVKHYYGITTITE